MLKKKRKVAIYEGQMLSTIKTFTDCIMSIIATIMVLQIPLPILLGYGRFSYSETFNALIIFFVSFLVVLSFYFEWVKFFTKITKISGWQIFTYCIFLMALSLFPFMTQLMTQFQTFTLAYIIYVFVVSRLTDSLMASIYRLNGRLTMREKGLKHWLTNLHIDLIVVIAVAILWGAFNWYNTRQFANLLMLYIPVRSLITAIVYDEGEENERAKNL